MLIFFIDVMINCFSHCVILLGFSVFTQALCFFGKGIADERE